MLPNALREVIGTVAPRVTNEMNDTLLSPIREKEVKGALFQMHPSKSPGSNGMSPLFYQNIGMLLVAM